MACAIYHCTCHVTRLYHSPREDQPRVFKGNTCAHDLNYVSTASELPRSPADVKDSEPAYIGIRLDKGHLICHNQVDKYMHCSTTIRDISFYDFIHRFSIVPKGSKPDVELLEDFTVTDCINKFPWYPF